MHLAIIIALALSFTACSDTKLTRAKAEKLIINSGNFKAPPSVQVRLGAYHISWKNIDEAMKTLGYISWRYRYDGMIFELTEKGREASRAWSNQGQEQWSIPIGLGRSINVTGIETKTSEARVEFSWEGTSLTPIAGELMKLGAITLPAGKGVAEFRLYDDGWRLIKVDM